MSIVQRDYLEQMIEEAAGALGQILQLARVGDLDLALILVGKTHRHHRTRVPVSWRHEL
jgi:hypothetical protein